MRRKNGCIWGILDVFAGHICFTSYTCVVYRIARSPEIALCQLPMQLVGSADDTEVSQWADAYSAMAFKNDCHDELT